MGREGRRERGSEPKTGGQREATEAVQLRTCAIASIGDERVNSDVNARDGGNSPERAPIRKRSKIAAPEGQSASGRLSRAGQAQSDHRTDRVQPVFLSRCFHSRSVALCRWAIYHDKSASGGVSDLASGASERWQGCVRQVLDPRVQGRSNQLALEAPAMTQSLPFDILDLIVKDLVASLVVPDWPDRHDVERTVWHPAKREPWKTDSLYWHLLRLCRVSRMFAQVAQPQLMQRARFDVPLEEDCRSAYYPFLIHALPKWCDHVKNLHLLWPDVCGSDGRSRYIYADDTLSSIIAALPNLESVAFTMQTTNSDLWASFPKSKASLLDKSSIVAFSIYLTGYGDPVGSLFDAFPPSLRVLDIKCLVIFPLRWTAAIAPLRSLETLRFRSCFPEYGDDAPQAWGGGLRDFQCAFQHPAEGNDVRAVTDILSANAATLETLIIVGLPDEDESTSVEEVTSRTPLPRLRSLACMLDLNQDHTYNAALVGSQPDMGIMTQFSVTDSLTELCLTAAPFLYLRLAVGLLKGGFATIRRFHIVGYEYDDGSEEGGRQVLRDCCLERGIEVTWSWY